jgi:PelA/Pel-15E family pectate lyase
MRHLNFNLNPHPTHCRRRREESPNSKAEQHVLDELPGATILGCGGKRSATPLSQASKSGALGLLPQSKTIHSQSLLDVTAALCFMLVGVGKALSAEPSDASGSAANPTAQRQLPAVDTSGFQDSRHHWLRVRDISPFIKVVPGQKEYRPAQVREIVNNILLFQRANGGWPKDYDMLAVLTPDQRAAVLATRSRADTSFDNGNVHSQVSYLAHAFAEDNDPEWHDACLRGFDFILAAQYTNGGFPQRYPNPKDFHAHITFNDYVMIGCLNVLQDAAKGAPQFAWLDHDRRERARDAVRRGVECILKCQIPVHGKLTGWCQQHDEITFEPRPARGFELASICPQDTTYIVRLLMRLQAPDKSVIHALDAAVAWLRQVELSGLRVERIKSPFVSFEKHDADFDLMVKPDPDAPPIWARHYEIGTDRPIFAGYDAVKRYSLAEVPRERRTGSAWYGDWPRNLLVHEYPDWQAGLKSAK